MVVAGHEGHGAGKGLVRASEDSLGENNAGCVVGQLHFEVFVVVAKDRSVSGCRAQNRLFVAKLRGYGASFGQVLGI